MLTSARLLAALLAVVVLATAVVTAVPHTRAAVMRQVRLSTGEVAPSYTEMYFQSFTSLPRKIGAGTVHNVEFFVFRHGSVRQQQRGVVLLSSSGRTQTVDAFSVKSENHTTQTFRATYQAPPAGRAFTITVMLLPTKLVVYLHCISVVS